MNRSGFLLLSSHLGNPERQPLTTAQLRMLTQRIQWSSAQRSEGTLQEGHLRALGYDRETAAHILSLLNEDALLQLYLQRGREANCVPITRQDPRYPLPVRKRLWLDSPGCLWAKGNLDFLNLPAISLVGSRNLQRKNYAFAREVGTQAARQGYVLISGNARGADTAAQEGCLAAGGKVISVVADALMNQPERANVLYISEEDYDAPFSSFRALRRNRVIHAWGEIVLVAQCNYAKGGTWSGTTKNLQKGWSRVYCYRDGSQASIELEQLGATLIDISHLNDFSQFSQQEISFL